MVYAWCSHTTHTRPSLYEHFRMSELANPQGRWSHHWSDGLNQSKESISNITNKYIYKSKILKNKKIRSRLLYRLRREIAK
jgi:hypothetical protein